MPGAQLAYVASKNPDTPGLVRKTTRVVPDWKEMVFAHDVDAVVIAAPTPHQPEIALAAFAAGKHVLLEKPLALNSADARKILEAAKKAKVYAAVDHVLLYHPAYAELSRRLAGKTLDRLTAHVRAMGPFREGVPSLWDYGSHPLAFALDLFGRSPDQAQAVKETADERSAGWRVDLDIDPSHAASSSKEAKTAAGGANWRVELSFGKAKAVLFAGNMAEKKEIRLEAVSGKKTWVFDDLSPHKLTENGKPVPVDADRPLTKAVEAFVTNASSGSVDLDSLELGVKVVETLERLTP